VRPHVARGEPAKWAARVDPKALPLVVHPALRPPPAPSATPASRSYFGQIVIAALSGLAFAWLLRKKSVYAQANNATSMAPLAPLLAGAAISGAVWLEMDRKLTLAAACVAAAIVLAMFRTQARDAHPARGVWRPIAMDLPKASDPFDATRPLGGAIGLATVVALVIVARALQWADEMAPIFVALDAAAFVPIFFTGVTPSRAVLSVRMLGELQSHLSDLETKLWARVPREGGDPLEYRLHVMPSAPIPGLTGIEVAIAWDRSGSASAAALQLLVRSSSQSPAHQRLLGLEAPSSREPGRTPDERVFRWADLDSPAENVEVLVLRLIASLEERRQSDVPLVGPDRRRRFVKKVRIAA
jgi:hypothetical protein